MNALEIAYMFGYYFLHYIPAAYDQMFLMVPILSAFSKTFWCSRDIRMYTNGNTKLNEQTLFRKNMHKFQMKLFFLKQKK